MKQNLRLKCCAQDCRDLARNLRDPQFHSMLLALAAQIDELAEAHEAFLKRYPAPESALARPVQ